MERVLEHVPLMVILAGVGAVAMLVPAGYAQALGQDGLARDFAISSGVSLVLIVVTALASAGRSANDRPRAVLLTLIGTFLILPAMLAAPLWFALPDTGLFNAWWEMLSCLTTTGATLYSAEILPDPLHLWRGLVGWLGGLFILIAAVAIMAPLRIGGFEIMSPPRIRMAGHADGPVEGLGGYRDLHVGAPIDPVHRFLRAGRLVVPAYAGLTLALWVMLLILGDSGLLALMRAMGTLSTSGILPISGAAAQPSGIPGEIAVFVLLIPALSRRFWPGGGELKTSESWRDDPELQIAAGVVLLVAFVLFLRHFSLSDNSGGGLSGRFDGAILAAWGGLFNALSYLTTTGWNSVEWEGARHWSGLTSPGLMLAGLAMMGGGVATTAGGVKLLRVHALAAHSRRELEKLSHPSSVGGGGGIARWLRTEGAFLAFVFFMLFATSIAVVVALVSLHHIRFETATILSIAALTNTGQLAGVIPLTPVLEGSAGMAGAPWNGWAGLAAFTKAVLAGAMVLGRVETLAILALFNPEIWRR